MNLEYNNGKHIIPKGAIRFSPSQMDKLIHKPHQWFREAILGEEGFTGSTASVLGSILHSIAEEVVNDRKPNMKEIDAYLDTFNDKPELEINFNEIYNQLKPMSERLVNAYILPNKSRYIFTEPFVVHKETKDVYIGGSIDAVLSINGLSEAQKQAFNERLDSENNLLPATPELASIPLKIIDYKSYNSKTKPKGIPYYYKYQLIAYGYILRNLGYTVEEIELVYISRYIEGAISEKTGKRLKSYPSTVTVLTERFIEEDYAFIKDIISMNVDKYLYYKQHPELAYILYNDPRLKEV